MTTLEDIERIKPLFKDNIKLYYRLIYQILDYNELLLVIPKGNIDYFELSKYISKKSFYENINKSWCLQAIIRNKNFTLDDILSDDRFIKYYDYLICNPSITIQQLIDNDLLTQFHIKTIMYNPNVTMDEFEKYKDQINWNDYGICSNYKEFNEKIIEYILYNNPYFCFIRNIFSIVNSKGFTYRLYLKYERMFMDYDHIQCMYNHIELSDINEFSKKYPIDYDYLSSNPNLTIDFIVENMDKPWNLIDLSFGRFIKHQKEQPYLQLKFVD